MQVLKAAELFKNSINIDNNEFENAKKIDLDFTNIKEIDLTAINMLLKLKKIAMLNNKSLSVSNVEPDICNILEITGLDKSLKDKKKYMTKE